MWNALRKKVNKSNRNYQPSAGTQNQSDSEDSDIGAGTTTKVVLKRYTKIPSCSDGLADTTNASVEPDAVAITPPRYENPYASLDTRTATTSAKSHVRGVDSNGSPTVDNAKHLLLSNDSSHDLRNNNHADDDVIRTDEHPDGNANHFSTATADVAGKVSPPRLKRREKASVVRPQVTVDELGSATSQCDNVILTSSQDTSNALLAGASTQSADDDESGYSTLRDILCQVECAMLEQQQQQHQQLHQLQTLTVTEDSDLDTSGDCRDIDLEQAGRSKSADGYHVPTVGPISEQPSTHLSRDELSGRSETCDQKQQQFNHEEVDSSDDSVDVNRNCADTVAEISDIVQRADVLSGAADTTSDHATHDYDVPRSTPVGGLRDHDDEMFHGVRRPRPPPPPPPPSDDNADDASSTPLDGTPRSQASCSTLTQQQCEPASASSTTDDSIIQVELNGDMLTVSEPTHMSWEEVLQSAHELGIPLQPQRLPPAIMTRSDTAAVRRSSTSSSVTSSDRSFVSSPINSPGARCRTSAPPAVLPRHLITRRTISSSPSAKQPKPKKTTKGASPFREKLHSFFAKKGDEHLQQSNERTPVSNASPNGSRPRSCSDKTRHRDRRDDVNCLRRPTASGDRSSPRISAEVSPSAAELINCGYRESMLSVLSSSFSSGSLGSIFSHASSSVSSSSSAAASRHHRHQYQHQQSSSSSSSSAWRNSFAG